MAGGERAEMRNGLGWCLPMEDTAGGKKEREKNQCMAHVDAFGQLPELL